MRLWGDAVGKANFLDRKVLRGFFTFHGYAFFDGCLSCTPVPKKSVLRVMRKAPSCAAVGMAGKSRRHHQRGRDATACLVIVVFVLVACGVWRESSRCGLPRSRSALHSRTFHTKPAALAEMGFLDRPCGK